LLPAISRKDCGLPATELAASNRKWLVSAAQIGFVFPAGDVRQSPLIKTAWLGHP
jgi:hypothetical protein